MWSALRVTLGFALIVYGGANGSLAGLVLMMAGIVPAVTGLADIIENVLDGRGTKENPRGRAPAGRVQLR